MSNKLDGIGLRMLSVRKKEGFTQSVMAAKLDISDRTYNYYEQEKRELPASIAVKFCELFSVDLQWLLLGITKSLSEEQLQVIAESVVAVFSEREESRVQFTLENLSQFVANVVERCEDGQHDPQDEARKLFKMVE